jgi:lipid II:glycine glycyltransferase (peptidoglycan interpeptide bridge formation enzyme)
LVGGAKDAISPAYTGTYASPSLSSLQIQEAWSTTVDWLRQRGAISLLLRHSPLLPQATRLPGQRWIVNGHPTIILELTDNESAWAEMEGRCRTSIRKAIKHGYTAEIRPAASVDLASDGEFRRLYEQTMQRRAAAPQYFFASDYYEQLLDGLGSFLLIGEVRNQAGSVVSSTLLMRHAGRLHYHLAGSKLEDARMGSNNLMLWTATQFAVAEGLRQFHLGGGVGVRDDLFKFKRSFGGRELEYGVSGLILDSDLYRVHTQNRAKACRLTTEDLLASNFFPAYRAGTISV